MESISVNRFRDNLKKCVEQVASQHVALKVTRRGGDDFVVLSADDWAREQETMTILQDTYLMHQIALSTLSHTNKTGYQPTLRELNEITGI